MGMDLDNKEAIEARAEVIKALVWGIIETRSDLIKGGGVTDACATRIAFEAFGIEIGPDDIQTEVESSAPIPIKRSA